MVMRITLEYSYSLGKWVMALYAGREIVTVLDAREVQPDGPLGEPWLQ